MPLSVEPYLSFSGNCAEAMRFYQRAIANGEGDLFLKTWADAPPEMQDSAAPRQGILHARFSFGRFALMASDITPEHRVAPNAMVNLSIGVDDVDEARRIFAALSDSGTVFMPIGKTPWAEAFGMLQDRYGFSWMVSVDHQ